MNSYYTLMINFNVENVKTNKEVSRYDIRYEKNIAKKRKFDGMKKKTLFDVKKSSDKYPHLINFICERFKR